MSVPFFKTKKDAQSFWGTITKRDPLVKVYVPADRGFSQARTSGNYWITKSYAKQLKLRVIK